MIVSSDRLHPLYRRTNAFLKCGPFTTSFNSQLFGAFKGLIGFPGRATSLKLITAAVFTQLRFSSDSRNCMCKMLNAPAADRNKDPILSVLKSRVKSDRHGNALEISSGTGQHVVHFANALPNITWQPSEVDSHSLSSIEVYRQHYRLPNVKPAIYLDASQSWETWYGIQPESCELIVNINMMHISPLACTKGLFNGVGKILKPQGLLLIYGPYSVNGTISPQSNVDFDHSLRSRNPDWGLRDISFLTSLGQDNGLRLEEIVDMPANNKCLLFRKDSVV